MCFIKKGSPRPDPTRLIWVFFWPKPAPSCLLCHLHPILSLPPLNSSRLLSTHCQIAVDSTVQSVADILVSLSVTFWLCLHSNLGSPRPLQCFLRGPSSTSIRATLPPSRMFATSLNSTLDLPCFIPPVCLLKPQLSCELTPQPEPTPVSPPSMSLLSRYRLRCKPRNLSCYHKPEPATTTSALHLSLLNTFLLNLSLVWLSTFAATDIY